MSEARWQRLSGLLDELFDLDAQARAARLAAIEADDAALAAELRRLLEADATSGVLDAGIARAAPTLMSRLAAPDADQAPAASVGKRVDHYRLVERVGSGGMGEVWRGERVDDFEQQVAIKLIRPLLDSPQLRERFARERRILARLDHPNIARLLDGGVAEDGTPWYAMEFVRGETITRHAEMHALDTRARVELLLQVCDAVAHAQSQLIVHRDLKPSNILVDAQGRARVLDFGIARLLDDSADTALTGTGVRVFSPAYAAPEQIRGENVGTAADVFALGAVLYELLTGEVPHPQRSATPERLIASLEHENAPRPSDLRRRVTTTGGATTGGARQLRGVAGDLDTIVATALQPSASRRYAGAAQLADDLRRWLDGRPIAAQPDTAGYRMRKFVARHRVAVGSASAVLLALVGGLGLALWQANVASRHAERANAEAQRAEREAAAQRAQVARTRKVKEFLVSIFLQADPLRGNTQSPPTIAEAFDHAVERARTELADDPVLQADVFDDFGEIRANQGRFADARALFEQALAVAEREYGPSHPIAAESLVNLSVVANYEGESLRAEALAERAVAILEADGNDPVALASALTSQATHIGSRGEVERATRITERAIALYRQNAPEDPGLLVAIMNLGTLLGNAGRLEESARLLEEAVELIERTQGPQAASLWPVLSTMAANAWSRGDADAEARLTERALGIARATYPDAHPWTAGSLVDRGLQRARAGAADAGIAMIEEGIAMYDELGSPDVVAALRYLALAHRQRDDDAGSLAALERAVEVCTRHHSPSHTLCLTIRANRAAMLARSGRPGDGLREADAALAGLQAYPTRFSERGQAMEARAAALAALGRPDEARDELDRVIRMLVEGFGAGHPEVARVRRQRAALD